MFTNIFVHEPTAIIIEEITEEIIKSDMLGDCSYRVIKIKGKVGVEVREQTYDDRYAGRFDKNEKYDMVITFRTDYMGEKAKEILSIKNKEVKECL